MSRRVCPEGGVEHHVLVACGVACQQVHEVFKRSNLCGAGARQLFAHLALLRGVAFRQLCDDPVPVGLGRGVGVDVHRLQARRAGHRLMLSAQNEVFTDRSPRP